MREGGRSHRQFRDVNILGRKNVPSLKKSKMSQFCYVPEYLRPKIFTAQKCYDYGNIILYEYAIRLEMKTTNPHKPADAINKQQTTNKKRRGGVFHFLFIVSLSRRAFTFNFPLFCDNECGQGD